ncbi:MAG TPA: hypothetical protein VEI97_01120, partial [bacterium]|nr:hypothetical protein [bacterium]
FHWGRREHAVAFYGCKVTPNDIQGALLRVPELGTCVADFALHPWEDSDANKRLDFWFMLREGHRSPENTGRAQDDFIAALAAVNQDFRESIRMVRPELRPALRFDPYGEGPLAGQDIRLKKRYVI